ncbi:hypothetical protein OESDEN_04853 [Oesophagostomum dentatum]|uniref:Uncharacterized protein n=1 Tax=Oesophagostomum dentatum TaxID=61180 RepID=A0A0B1TIJ5_OESDE|nr:hypothetical protein OESDEN_04853 [Oesophagostomum dentatum]
MCNTVAALMASLRAQNNRGPKNSALPHIMLNAIERALKQPSEQAAGQQSETVFFTCLAASFIFALGAVLHLAGVLMTAEKFPKKGKITTTTTATTPF